MTIQAAIQSQLSTVFHPDYVDVLNESHGHSVAPGSETHFKVILVSSTFESLSAVQRHRKVYGALAEFLTSGVHALALHTYTPLEWQNTQQAPASPPCLGSNKSS
jgi:BolA family transcriptional regulator, general stress-responsive regulator